MIEHSKKINIFFFIAGLPFKGSTPVGDIGITAVSIKYPNIPFYFISDQLELN